MNNSNVPPMFPLQTKKPCKSLIYKANTERDVILLGLEPRAHTLKVYCSTN